MTWNEQPNKLANENNHKHRHRHFFFREQKGSQTAVTIQPQLTTLKDIKIGECAEVVEINARGPLRRRFMDMGITRGTMIEVMKYAPMGDPMELRLRNYVLSIRKSEAELIIVQNSTCKQKAK